MFLEAAKKSNLKVAESESLIKVWLRNAPDRHGGRKARAEKAKGEFIQQ